MKNAQPAVERTSDSLRPPQDERTASPRKARLGLPEGRNFDDLLDETMGEMSGASEAARREEVPIVRLQGTVNGEATPFAGPRMTPMGMVAEASRVEALPSARPARRVSRALALVADAMVIGSMIALGLGWLSAHRSLGARRAAAVTSPVGASVAASKQAAPPPAASADPPAAPSTIASIAHPAPPLDAVPVSPASTVGSVKVMVAGRRVFIDGRLAGEGPRVFPLSCGTHKIRVGSAGAIRAVDVPCGGETVLEKP